jgi:phasin family protein
VIRSSGRQDIRHFTPLELVMSDFDPVQEMTAAQKAGLETTLGLLSKAFEDIEKLVELNARVVKSFLAEHQEITARALSVKEPQELFAQLASQTQPVMETAQSYWRDTYGVISSRQSEFQAAAGVRFQQFSRETQALADMLAQNAPAGSETAFATWKAFVKTASETASTTYAAATKATW